MPQGVDAPSPNQGAEPPRTDPALEDDLALAAALDLPAPELRRMRSMGPAERREALVAAQEAMSRPQFGYGRRPVPESDEDWSDEDSGHGEGGGEEDRRHHDGHGHGPPAMGHEDVLGLLQALQQGMGQGPAHMAGGGMIDVSGLVQHLRQRSEYMQNMGAGLDVDNMSYEELLAMQDRAGFVSRGAKPQDVMARTEVVPSPAGDAEQCCICLTDFAATRDNDCRRINACGHVFHDRCIARWFDDSHKCPVCNSDI